MINIIQKIENRKNCLEKLKHLEKDILKAADIILEALKNGNKILFCANGGSASQASHLACEFIVKFKDKRKSLPAISLTADNSVVTAIGNDFSFEDIFKRQIEGLGNKNDVLIALSTSGRSKNVLEALKQAKSQNLKTIFLTGENEPEADCDCTISIPSGETAQIQEMHILIGHLICEIIEENFN